MGAETSAGLPEGLPGHAGVSRAGRQDEAPAAVHAVRGRRAARAGPIPLMRVVVRMRSPRRYSTARAYGVPPEIPITLNSSSRRALRELLDVLDRIERALAAPRNPTGRRPAGSAR